jgi:hypothetical protein
VSWTARLAETLMLVAAQTTTATECSTQTTALVSAKGVAIFRDVLVHSSGSSARQINEMEVTSSEHLFLLAINDRYTMTILTEILVSREQQASVRPQSLSSSLQ